MATSNDIIEIAGKRFIRLSTFADEMGLHIRTVQLWAKQEGMPVIRVGNQMLLDLDDLPAWFNQHKISPENNEEPAQMKKPPSPL